MAVKLERERESQWKVHCYQCPLRDAVDWLLLGRSTCRYSEHHFSGRLYHLSGRTVADSHLLRRQVEVRSLSVLCGSSTQCLLVFNFVFF